VAMLHSESKKQDNTSENSNKPTHHQIKPARNQIHQEQGSRFKKISTLIKQNQKPDLTKPIAELGKTTAKPTTTNSHIQQGNQ